MRVIVDCYQLTLRSAVPGLLAAAGAVRPAVAGHRVVAGAGPRLATRALTVPV